MVSFGYIVIATLLIAGGAIFATLVIPINQIFTAYNNFVVDGWATQQNYEAMNFQHDIILIFPLMILLGVAAWGIVRAIEKRNEGGFQ